MANKYWVGIAAGWDDGVVGVATPWASSSGGSDNVDKPANGDDVYFDGAGGSDAPTSGPGSAVSLHRLDLTSITYTLPAVDLVTISATGTLIYYGASEFTGTFTSGATASFFGISSTSAVLPAGSTINFAEDTACLSDSATSTTTINFTGNAFCNANLSAGIVTFSDFASVNAASVNVTSATFLSGEITGGGGIVGPVFLVGSSINVDITITGNVTISGTATNQGDVNGNVTLTVATARNEGVVSGTLTAPYSTGPGAYGSFGALNLTGLPRGGPVVIGRA